MFKVWHHSWQSINLFLEKDWIFFFFFLQLTLAGQPSFSSEREGSKTGLPPGLKPGTSRTILKFVFSLFFPFIFFLSFFFHNFLGATKRGMGRLCSLLNPRMSATNWYFSQNWLGNGSQKSDQTLSKNVYHVFIYSNSKCIVTCKNADFECQYIRAHTKERLSRISNIAFVILPFYQKKILKLNGHPEFRIRSSTRSCPYNRPSTSFSVKNMWYY